MYPGSVTDPAVLQARLALKVTERRARRRLRAVKHNTDRPTASVAAAAVSILPTLHTHRDPGYMNRKIRKFRTD